MAGVASVGVARVGVYLPRLEVEEGCDLGISGGGDAPGLSSSFSI